MYPSYWEQEYIKWDEMGSKFLLSQVVLVVVPAEMLGPVVGGGIGVDGDVGTFVDGPSSNRSATASRLKARPSPFSAIARFALKGDDASGSCFGASHCKSAKPGLRRPGDLATICLISGSAGGDGGGALELVLGV